MRRRVLVGVGGVAIVAALALRGPIEWQAYQARRLQGSSLAQLEAFVAANPKHANGKYYLALAYVRAGQMEKAPKLFREALVLDPVRADIFNDLGATYLLQRRYYESLIALQASANARPDYAPAWANLGRLHLATDMAYTATGELKKANTLQPGDVEVLCDLGGAYLRTLNYHGCEAAYREAIQRKPDHIRAYVGMGLVLQEKGMYDDALQYLTRAQKLAPDDPTVLATLGQISLKKGAAGDRDRAQIYLQRAVEKDPSLTDSWTALGNLQLLRGKPSEALEPLSRALQVSPGNMAALNLLERALRRSGQVAEADRVAQVFKQRALWEREETVMEERTMRNAEDWDAVARLAELYLLSNKRYKAIWLTSRLKEGAPYHPKLPKLLQAVGPNALSGQGAPPVGGP